MFYAIAHSTLLAHKTESHDFGIKNDIYNHAFSILPLKSVGLGQIVT